MMTSSRKVFDVLEFLCQTGPSKAVEISQALGLQKSSVHRFLNSLMDFGYVHKNEQTGLFGPTLKIVQLGLVVGNRINIVDEALPHMRELVQEFKQTVGIGTLLDNMLLVLHREYPRNSITRIDMNQRLPAYCTGMGKALLATLKESDLEAYLATVPRTSFTPHTLVDEDALKADIALIRNRGFAEDNGEISDSLHCVSVFAGISQGRAWAISVSGHVNDISKIGVSVIVRRLRYIVQSLTATRCSRGE